MSIEFPCTSCGQTLRVADDAAGRRAKCPKCRSVVEIPLDKSPAATGSSPQGAWNHDGNAPFGAEEPNPYSAPEQSSFPSYSAQAGSPFASTQVINVPVDVGRILNYAWEIWTQNMGLLVGAFVVMAAIRFVLAWGQQTIFMVLIESGQDEAALSVSLIWAFARWLVDVYLGVGFCQMTLRMARRQPVDFSELFNGGSRVLPVLGVSILFGLAIVGGLILLIVPGIVVALMWWPCYYLVVENKATVSESFAMARYITRDNVGNSFLMFIVGGGITLVGFLAFCIGIIFAAPLAAMLSTVAYLMMSGQIPPEPTQKLGSPFA